jgi:CheY-like chemotaxis protein
LFEEPRLRLIVVDDDDRFAALVTALLEADGRFEILARAFNGAEAVERVRALRPDLVLMDFDMPVMDGGTATRRIAAFAPGTRVVLVTGSEELDRVLEARIDGASEFVRKSRIHEDLLDAIFAATTA